MAIEHVFRVYPEVADALGAHMEIREYPEDSDYLEVYVPQGASRDWFGEQSITGTPEFFKELGEAMVKAAEAKLNQR